MKKYIFIIICLVLLIGGYLFYSNNQEKQKVQLKNDVVIYLEEKGYFEDDYKNPEYITNKSFKGDQSKNIKIIFNKDKNYEYFYMKKNEEIQLFYAFNKNTSEQEFNKKEP